MCLIQFFHVRFIMLCAFSQKTSISSSVVVVFWLLQISDLEGEAEFTAMLTNLLDEHKDVVSMLADGFYQSRDYIEVSRYQKCI